MIGGKEALFQEMVMQKINPRFPVVAAGLVDQHHRDNSCLSGLHQSQTLEPFVHRPETTREQRQGVAFLQEIELPGKEIVKLHELRISIDYLVGSLFERHPDI